MTDTAIYWIRRDLRLDDNPALQKAMSRHRRVLPLYIHAPDEEARWRPGAASNWWLHNALTALDHGLRLDASRLCIRKGPSLETLLDAAGSVGASHVYHNRLYDPAIRKRDSRVELALREHGIACEGHNGTLLQEPSDVLSEKNKPYRAYSAFRRRILSGICDLRPVRASGRPVPTPEGYDGIPLEQLELLPRAPWDHGLKASWQPGEAAAIERAKRFTAGPDLDAYDETRDQPALSGTSRLSPYLHFGEIGPRRLIAMIHEHQDGELSAGARGFLDELLWREFAHYLLFHFPRTPEHPLDPRFERFPWRERNTDALMTAWRQGTTGIPLVDAGMRELWHTGWMHNRVRMVVASFLTKNLRIPWQLGARWFWDTLVDADLANNTLGWQWTAGCGADAAPYFRIFNPVRQGERFDPKGRYVRRWCPELARLPDRYIHQPWAASPSLLHAAGITLGRDYPHPIVDLARTRTEALEAFASIK